MGIQDRLKKQIDQLGKALARILSDLLELKAQGRFDDGIEITNQTLKTELGLDLEKLTSIEPDDIINVLKTEKGVSNDSLSQLADLLLLIADETEAGDNMNLYQNCLVIYEYLEKNESVYSLDRRWKIERIKKLL